MDDLPTIKVTPLSAQIINGRIGKARSKAFFHDRPLPGARKAPCKGPAEVLQIWYLEDFHLC